MEYHNNHNVSIRIARIFNTYGPNMDKDDGRVVSNFLNQVIDKKDITLYGKGDQTRSFCYVDDMVDGLIKLMNNEKTNGPINLGNPQEITIKELAEKVIELTKSDSNIIYKDLPKDDPMKRNPDITKAKEFLDWIPKFELEDGLIKTYKYFISLKK